MDCDSVDFVRQELEGNFINADDEKTLAMGVDKPGNYQVADMVLAPIPHPVDTLDAGHLSPCTDTGSDGFISGEHNSVVRRSPGGPNVMFISGADSGTKYPTPSRTATTHSPDSGSRESEFSSLVMAASVGTLLDDEPFDEDGLLLINPDNIFENRSSPSSSYSLESTPAPTPLLLPEEIQTEATTDRLSYLGIINIAKNLKRIYGEKSDVQMLVNNSPISEASSWTASSPAYCYMNETIAGWRRDVHLGMSGKSQGTLSVSYLAPYNNGRRIRNRSELANYLTSNSTTLESLCGDLQPTSAVDFKTVYCVCHQPAGCGPYIECSFGLCGCQGWVHPHCIGLGYMSEMDIQYLDTIICPLCTHYLEGINEISYFENKV
jgi:hypothetical protein